ncbi:hypothetical protein [Polymorphospora sp. A560]|uniref:hypothetical protein n=1 Tax=Polymorphospora sp. A560 TaxID=3040203 RepID=UPI00389181AA
MTGGPDTGARRHRRAGRGLAGLAVLVAALAWPTPARADPAVTVTPAAARLDQTVTVELTGWPPGVVTVALCGNEARQGSADCAVATAAAATVPDAGTTRVPLRLTPPPAGCPCVVRAVTATGDRAGAAALAVVDVPDSATVSGPAGQADGPRTVELVAARLDERWTLPGLLGGPAERTLRLDLRNPSGTPLRDLVLTLDLGRAAGTGGAPPPVPVPDLAAGERRVVEVPVTIGAPAVGRYPVTGRIDGLDAPVTFTAHTSSWPWLLPVVLPLVVCGVVLARRLRARPGRRGRPGRAGRSRTRRTTRRGRPRPAAGGTGGPVGCDWPGSG